MKGLELMGLNDVEKALVLSDVAVTSINDKWIGLNGISARPLLKAVVWITV
jgi:hypothetical protein